MIDLIKTDPRHKDVKGMYLKRMLRALHPDKVNGTPLESLFDSITKEIVKMRESVRACLLEQSWRTDQHIQQRITLKV